MSDIQLALRETISEILESFAFLFAEPVEDAPLPEGASDYRYASVNFNGASQGMLFVCADRDLCAELAANVLGAEAEEVDEACAMDALKELANIVVGSLMARLFGTDKVCELSAPDACAVDLGKVRELAADRSNIRLLIDDRMMIAGTVLAE